RVAIEGAIKTRKWQDKEGHDRWSTEIVVGRFDGKLTLEGSPSGNGGTAQRDERSYGDVKWRGAEPKAPPPDNDLNDDIPF
ncbi:MAG: single-stranded DNA-binding protein, partial [Beijerinckiaceae bacterium]